MPGTVNPRFVAGLVVAAAAVAAGVSLATSEATPDWQPRFHAFHADSALPGDGRTGFREVFIVHDVDPAFRVATAGLEIRLDGVPFAVNWTDADGALGDGDVFWFVQEAFDRQQVLTAWHGEKAMECRFGGGAGAGFTPEWFRAEGQPEQVRCLDALDDG